MTERIRAIIVGAPRCGTTSLWRYLSHHPQIARSIVKEASFFDQPGNSTADYDTVFVRGGDATLEASPIYFHEHERNAPALAKAVPDARLIFILREPAARLAANFRGKAIRPDEIASGMDFAKFARIVATDGDPLPINPGNPRQAADVKDLAKVGIFADVLETYLAHFKPEQMLVMFLDDLETRPGEAVARACRHIGVDPDAMPAIDYAIENKGGYVRNRRVYDFLRTVNRKFEPVINYLPWLRRTVKSLHHRVNSAPASQHDATEEEGRAILRDWYRPANSRLALMMRKYWPDAALPQWLESD